MGNRLRKHWTEFDRMLRRLGALRLERDGVLGADVSTSCSRVVETFGEAVAAVWRFGCEARADSTAADQAWDALDRASEAALQARALAIAAGSSEPAAN